MNIILDLLYISLGASLGALCRWLISLSLNSLFPLLPPGTFLVNILGSFLMGLFMALLMQYPLLASWMRPLLLTGFLGSFTTFSTFAAEMGALLQQEKIIWLSLGVLLHVGVSISWFLLGLWLGKFVKSA